MSTEYGNDFYNNGTIEVTASSIIDDNRVPINVFKKDNSCWYSNNVKNSWIQFDFKTRSISLKSYSLRSCYIGPKCWKIEGSNDMDTFILIDQRNNNNNFRDGYVTQHYDVNSTEDQKRMRFRYIRITQGDDGNWYNNHCFSLNRVEFYGSLYEQTNKQIIK